MNVDPNDACKGLTPIVRLVRRGIFPIVQIGIPIILIIKGTIDLGKAVISSDEKEIKAAQSRLIKRCIYAVVIFFIVTLVTLLMNLVTIGDDQAGANGWSECWRIAA